MGKNYLKRSVFRHVALPRILRLRHALPSIIGDGSWTLASKMYTQVIQLTIFIVAARILQPAEFGFFAFASAIAVILVVLSEGGWREFVLKSRDCRERLDEIATMSVIAASSFTVIAMMIAVYYSHYEETRWEAMLIGLFSFWIVPAALSAIFEGVLISNNLVRKQARITIAAETAGFAFAVAGLWLGWSVMALVAGRLAMQLTYLSCAMLVTRWVPRPRFEWSFTLELLDFSRHILFNRVLQQVRSYAGTLAVGMFLGMTEAGLFRAAERIVAAISELVAEPARTLSWVVFRRSMATGTDAAQKKLLADAATHFNILLIFAATPIFLGLALIAPSVIEILLGEHWAPAAIVVSFLCIKQVLLTPATVTEPLLSVSGYVRKLPPVALLNAIVAVAAMAVFAPFGLMPATLGQVAAAAIALATTFYLQGRYGGVIWSNVMRESVVLLVANGALAGLTIWLGSALDSTDLGVKSSVAIQVLAGATCYGGILLAAWFLGYGQNLFPARTGRIVRSTKRIVAESAPAE